ncbi:hypothetical protein [Mastigocoleus testarum]|uniref:Uncharacterized protein n=1 Tax=Mastigocoleus testarum BC008 TaxID=371196 RepID=A0A0V7ZLI8_9CYAN|nr:hypothetical protein [Mastigocoleus testarum]KST65266.1 hypothetical protein BC008_20970 [Mastigocoleus testarum BC008]KST68945.1 hypothetical protein BC008_02405 [Mastigocoleus testarum BC008]
MLPLKDTNNRGTWFLERFLVPTILILVALLQFYLAHTANLSPWKGGGFGMFAAVDSPSMRVLAAEGLAEGGQLIRLDALDSLDNSTIRRILSLPRQIHLEQIASELISEKFVPQNVQRQTTLERLRRENPKFAIQVSGILLKNQPIYRLKTPEDPILLNDSVKTLKAIRLQWWSLRFDRNHNRLLAEPLGEPVEAGNWS